MRARTGVFLTIVAFVTGAAAMAGAAVIAGLWNGTSNPVILNGERVELAIEGSIQQQRHLDSTVSCPGNIEQRRGVRFYCQATVHRHSYSVAVTEVDSRGHVTFMVL